MADWKTYFEERTISIEEAAKKIESGDVIWPGQTTSVPYSLVEAITDRYEEFENVTLLSNMFLAPLQILFDPCYKKSIKLITVFPNILERTSAELGIIDFLPINYSYFSRAMKEVFKVNTTFFEVTPPDEDGYVNVGALGVGWNSEVVEYATKKIAVINAQHKPILGPDDAVKIHVSKFDWFCIDEHELPAIPPSDPDEVDIEIAKHIHGVINDGDTFQVGMGGLPNAILKSLTDRKDLKVFTEILTDGMVDLAEAGVVTKMEAIGAFGMPRLYDFFANPMCSFDKAERMINPWNIAEHENLISVNATFMVDLTGQMASEAIGPRQYASTGGQLDFVRGATLSKGGKSYMCLRSARRDSEGNLHSNIVAQMPKGTIITTSRQEAMYIVTEYGIADVFRRPIKDRIKALIAVAHPDCREELKAQAIAQGNIFEDDFDL